MIKIIVGNEPGGGYDRMARLLAKHLPKYISGKPTIIVENMPGAAGMIAANYLYNLAKPDGLTIGSFNQGLPFAQLLKAEGMKFDLTKFSWIGSASFEPSLLAVRADLSYKTPDDLRKAKDPIPLGHSGPGTQTYQFPILLMDFAGFSFKMVAYPSATASILAMERKETDLQVGTLSTLTPYFERGLMRFLIRGRISEPRIENLPVDEELTTDKMAKTIMAMRSATDQVARPYVAPPNTSAEVMKILWDAFAKVTKDPELQEEARKFRMTVEYIPADQCFKMLNYVLNQPEDTVKEFSKHIKF